MPFERWERAKKKKIIWGLIEVFLCFFDFEGSCSSLCFFVFFCFGCCCLCFFFLFLFLLHFAVLEILVGIRRAKAGGNMRPFGFVVMFCCLGSGAMPMHEKNCRFFILLSVVGPHQLFYIK